MINTMTLEDMTMLVKVYDSYDDIIDGLSQICDIDENSGTLEGKWLLLSVMEHYTVLDTTEREEDPFTPFRVTVDNKSIPAEDRAKLILGM